MILKTAHSLCLLALEPPGVRVPRAFSASIRHCWRGERQREREQSSDFRGWSCEKTDNKCCGIDYKIWQCCTYFCPWAE